MWNPRGGTNVGAILAVRAIPAQDNCDLGNGSGLSDLLQFTTEVHYRPSIIRPAPGRYVNVGTEGDLCSCFCSAGLASGSTGRSIAVQPMNPMRTTNRIDDLNRAIPIIPVSAAGSCSFFVALSRLSIQEQAMILYTGKFINPA